MLEIFKNIAKRVQVERELRDFFKTHTNINIEKISAWKLSKVTDRYFIEIARLSSPTEEEQLIVYLMLLHDSCAFNKLENEMLLSVIIKIIKFDQSRMAFDEYRAVFRKGLKEQINSWLNAKLLS
jgi:hypothetical protein